MVGSVEILPYTANWILFSESALLTPSNIPRTSSVTIKAFLTPNFLLSPPTFSEDPEPVINTGGIMIVLVGNMGIPPFTL